MIAARPYLSACNAMRSIAGRQSCGGHRIRLIVFLDKEKLPPFEVVFLSLMQTMKRPSLFEVVFSCFLR